MSLGPPPGADPGAPPPSAPSPAKPRRRTALWAGVAIFVLALVIIAGVVGSLPSPKSGAPGSPPPNNGNTTVNVTKVDWRFGGASCFGATNTTGTSVRGGGTFNVSLPVNYTGGSGKPSSCTVDSETMQTSGFILLGSNTPLEVSAGGSATLELEISAPNQNETEPVTVSGSVSSGPWSKTVNVTSVRWKFSGAGECWSEETSAGKSVIGGSQFGVLVSLSYTAGSGDPDSCTVQSATVSTPGFSYVSGNTPLLVDSGTTQTLSVTLGAPDTNESIAVTVNATVTSAPWPKSVNITAVNWDFSGPSECWSSETSAGKVVGGGSQFGVTIQLTYTAGLLDPDSCTVQSASVSTSGFTYVGANTPLVVDTGTTQTLSVTLDAPDSNETVALTIDATVTAP
jgi:hypothetical protein